MAIVTSTDPVSSTAWVSLSLSALAAGFISASISYDWDTSPKRRGERASFYGFIPAKAGKRTICFVAMLLLSTGMLLVRAYTIVLLALVGNRWAFAYFILDILFFLAIKVLRREFWYWMPTGSVFTDTGFSLVVRIVGKIVLDFTSLVQFRHPFEFGGALWSLNLLVSIASFPISLYIFQANGGDLKVAEKGWSHSLILLPSVVLTYVVLLYNIEKDYLSTFISPMNIREFLAKTFRESTSDEARATNFFSITTRYWDSTENEARHWVAQNWDRWMREKPPWLTDVMRERIPLHFIPKGKSQRKESIRRKSQIELEGRSTRKIKKNNNSITPVISSIESGGGADGGDIIGAGGGKAPVDFKKQLFRWGSGLLFVVVALGLGYFVEW